jgi:hypothetical protein
MSLQPATHFDSSPYLFTARELARLAVYRAAIVARFYTDQLETPAPHASDISRLLQTPRGRREQRAA